ncbi:MAG TPA: glycosyltransferase [Patescibacteria group bacterium]|nr:glycosyltransferase [Patescibacteria group bacterium]
MPKKFLLLTAFVNLLYLMWLAEHISGSLLSLVFLFAESAVSALSFIFIINHLSPKQTYHSVFFPQGTVDVFITVVDEPLHLLAAVIASAATLDYPHKTVYILDDGERPAVQILAKRYNAVYLSRPNKPEHYKAGNLNFGLENSNGDFILTLDADQRVTDPALLSDLLGHFYHNPKLALISTRQSFDITPDDFNNDTLFYEYMQPGKNSDNAAISTGSGAIYRREALKSIGGFQIWNLVEDMYTSYTLQVYGYNTLYINKPYTKGTAPYTLRDIYKQRGTWALDTFRMFFRDNPIFKKTLSLRQKFHYMELGLTYMASALAIPVLALLPVAALWTNLDILTDPLGYVFVRLPSLVLLLYMYYVLSGNFFSSSQYWASLSIVYLKAMLLALRSGKPKYSVTCKVAKKSREITFILPHLTYVALATMSSVWYVLENGVTGFFLFNLLLISLMIFWFYPVIMRGLETERDRVAIPGKLPANVLE